jgi:hypothetical protein
MELAQRVNHAYMLLKKATSPSEILEVLIKQYGVSRIQAYRYIRLAKAGQGPMLILEPSVVFTVKLEPSLIKRVKAVASSMSLSISKLVKMALEEFLSKHDRGEREKAS